MHGTAGVGPGPGGPARSADGLPQGTAAAARRLRWRSRPETGMPPSPLDRRRRSRAATHARRLIPSAAVARILVSSLPSARVALASSSGFRAWPPAAAPLGRAEYPQRFRRGRPRNSPASTAPGRLSGSARHRAERWFRARLPGSPPSGASHYSPALARAPRALQRSVRQPAAPRSTPAGRSPPPAPGCPPTAMLCRG